NQIAVDPLCQDCTSPADITARADPGMCSKANVTWTVPAVDGCTVTAATCNPASGSTFQVGSTPVNCTFTDGENQPVHCSFTVTITDDEAPVARCKDITVPLDANGHATITASQ